MTSTQQRSSGTSFLESLKKSPATQQLTEQARGLASAHAGKISGKLGDKVGSLTKSLGNVGESGQLPAVGEGAKRLLQGDSPAKAAVGAATTSVKEKAKGLLGKLTGKGKGSGQKKALDIEESIDVGVPVSTAYDQWTQFTEFSRFMKGVESVEQSSETETTWRAKVFKSRRTWKATVQEQIPDHRIVWTSEGAKGSTKGVVTFHPLGEDLTRILLTMEYFPQGMFEKTGNIWRAQGRRARLDLKNFRRFVMTEDQATGSWRGEIRDGEVTKQPDENDSGGQQQKSKQPSKQKAQQAGQGKGAPGRSGSGSGSRSGSRGSGEAGRGSRTSAASARSGSGRNADSTGTNGNGNGNGKARSSRRQTAAAKA